MPGENIQLFSRQLISFTNLTASQTLVVPIRDRVDVSQWTQGTLLITSHSKTITTSGSTIAFTLHTRVVSPDDPATIFALTAASATVTVAQADASPLLYAGQLSTGFGPMLLLRATGSMAAGGGSLQGEFSGWLSLKS